jgi:hypothetical protein
MRGAWVLLAMVGCVARESGVGTTESSSTTTSTSAGASSEATSSSEGTTTSSAVPDVAAPIDCFARNEAYECPPMDCAAPIYPSWQCGSIWVDDDGCLRPFCKSEADCPEEHVCFKYAECDPEDFCWTFAGCGLLGDECHCGAVGGCPDEAPPIEDQQGICIPPALRPC